MSKYLGVAVLVLAAIASSGCRCRERGLLPGWFRTSCDNCANENTAYDPATPYFDGAYPGGGYSVPGMGGVDVLPAPGN